MGVFSLYIRYRSDSASDETAMELLDRFVDEYDGAGYEPASIDVETEPGVTIPENGLDIEDIETFASVFSELDDNPAVHDISLWGPGSQRFPVRVYHHALRNLSSPDQYQFHAIDNRETLLVCDTRETLQRARKEIGPAGLVEGGNAKF